MERRLRMQIIGFERHRGINERATMLGTEELDECSEDKALQYVEYLRQQPFPLATRDGNIEAMRQEVQRRGLIGIKTKDGMKPYLTAEGAINAFREDHPDAGIDLDMVEYDDHKAIFKATISDGDKLLASGYGMETASFRKYFEKAQTSAIQRALKAIGYNTSHELNELAEQGFNMIHDTSSATAAIPAEIADAEHENGFLSPANCIDLEGLVGETKRRTKPASEKQIGLIKGKVNAGKIDQYFGKNPVLLTDGEANLAIKASFGEISWDDVTCIMARVRSGGMK